MTSGCEMLKKDSHALYVHRGFIGCQGWGGEEVKVAVRLFAEYCLHKHLHMIEVVDDTTCRTSREDEDNLQHILTVWYMCLSLRRG